MHIYKATIKEFHELWNYSESNTYKYFLQGIHNNSIELWTVEIDNKLIAELYIFWDSADKDEANGFNRAYLCAFRVKKEYQGKGIGSKLMSKVVNRIREKGFNEITIGIDNREYNKLKTMYEKFGFTELVKSTNVDLHYMDDNNNPTTYDEEYQIYINRLRSEGQ